MRKVFPLNPVLLSNIRSVQRGRVILGAKVEGIHEYPTQLNLLITISLVAKGSYVSSERPRDATKEGRRRRRILPRGIRLNGAPFGGK